ncbi:hypothetical protein RJ53_10830 [Methanocalculus chunghsingensis]|uniref:Glycosyltransferase 2-like domain-containing protein n=1 Tax=Methanocalculus chunghsingensis TaxID=156457 RepID=A0A8J8B687_9EURY|nr:glycosyltransferase family 2 protein [Methanocalculus chunghsingensis]MBR1369943.1 hypothetical protein [Methanocalculus chunghsingensis]
MYREKRIAVVVPAHNEELLILDTLETVPDFVDRVYVIDDCSKDATLERARAHAKKDARVTVIHHEVNGGVGASITTGFKAALIDGTDILTVMAGDNQMDPVHLPTLIDPIVEGKADFTKGSRLKPGYWKGMSNWRLFGNMLLNLINKIASGYWIISDPQNGYIAISSTGLSKMDLNSLYPRYAFENDMMIKANVHELRMFNIFIPAKYGSETSDIKYGSFILSTSYFLFKSFIWRIIVKLLIYRRLVYFGYVLGMLCLVLGAVMIFFGEWNILLLGFVLFIFSCIGEYKHEIRSLTEDNTNPTSMVKR